MIIHGNETHHICEVIPFRREMHRHQKSGERIVKVCEKVSESQPKLPQLCRMRSGKLTEEEERQEPTSLHGALLHEPEIHQLLYIRH